MRSRHHSQHSRRHSRDSRHEHGKRRADLTPRTRKQRDSSTAGASHSRHRPRRPVISRRLRRLLLGNPLIPLLTLVAIVLFALFQSESQPTPEVEQMQPESIRDGFADAQIALHALQLMDAKQLDEAARSIQGLNIPPMRLSSLMGSVRLDTSEARQTLRSVICNWVLDQEAESHGTVFPSKDTPTPLLDFIASFEQYRRSSKGATMPHAKDRELAALFKRVSIEKQIRILGMPVVAKASAADEAPASPYAPPVESP